MEHETPDLGDIKMSDAFIEIINLTNKQHDSNMEVNTTPNDYGNAARVQTQASHRSNISVVISDAKINSESPGMTEHIPENNKPGQDYYQTGGAFKNATSNEMIMSGETSLLFHEMEAIGTMESSTSRYDHNENAVPSQTVQTFDLAPI